MLSALHRPGLPIYCRNLNSKLAYPQTLLGVAQDLSDQSVGNPSAIGRSQVKQLQERHGVGVRHCRGWRAYFHWHSL